MTQNACAPPKYSVREIKVGTDPDEGGETIFDAAEDSYYKIVHANGVVIACTVSPEFAEELIRACNSHDALVAVCQAALLREDVADCGLGGALRAAIADATK